MSSDTIDGSFRLYGAASDLTRTHTHTNCLLYPSSPLPSIYLIFPASSSLSFGWRRNPSALYEAAVFVVVSQTEEDEAKQCV